MDYINTNREQLLLRQKRKEQDRDCAKRLWQSLNEEVESLKSFLGNQTSKLPTLTDTPEIPRSDSTKIIAIKNGKRLPDFDPQNINEDDFDLILNMVTASLKYRKDPGNQSDLTESNLKGIGPTRISFLTYLLEDSNRTVSHEDVLPFHGPDDIVCPEAFRKSICMLRNALDQTGPKGPYIITEKNLRGRYYSYRLNSKWNYLLIKKNKSHT